LAKKKKKASVISAKFERGEKKVIDTGQSRSSESRKPGKTRAGRRARKMSNKVTRDIKRRQGEVRAEKRGRRKRKKRQALQTSVEACGEMGKGKI